MTSFHKTQFYHIYPLGFCGAPGNNDFCSEPFNRLSKIKSWLPHIRSLGANALYLGPVFESTSHGYDTRNYFLTDRRLGTNADLKDLSDTLHQNGISLILDGVFNHTGRDFFAFKDLQENGSASKYMNWFHSVDFSKRSPCGDNFSYEGWNGHFNLVKLNLRNPEVKNHLFEAVRFWVQEFDIDGIRLDAADCLDLDFIRELSLMTKSVKPGFFLLGEVIHGNYRKWSDAGLDSVTNYEAYKGLWSSHNDANYFEIAYTLKRQFAEGGLYQNLPFYNFIDNHDVDRAASTLKNPAHLYLLNILLYTIPGIPSVYYGSEWGISGKKTNGSDTPMRPDLDLNSASKTAPEPDLLNIIRKLSALRESFSAFQDGNYQELLVASKQFAFLRKSSESCITAVNSDSQEQTISLNLPEWNNRTLKDLLNPGEIFNIRNSRVSIPLYPNWGRIMAIV